MSSYLAVVIAAIWLVVPVHVACYRERDGLRRVVAGAVAFTSLGLLIGAWMPNARAAGPGPTPRP